MGDQRLPENQPGQISRCKHVLKHKKEQLTFPPVMEGHRQLFSHEKLEHFPRNYEPCEEMLSHRNIWGTFFPRISHEAPSSATNKSHRKVPKDLGMICSMSMDQQNIRRMGLNHLSKMEDDAEDYHINLRPMLKHDWNLNKWPHLENQREVRKNSKNGNHLHRIFNLKNSKNFRSCQRIFLHRNTSTDQNLLGSLNYKYIQSGGDVMCKWNDAFENLDAWQQFDMDHAYQTTYENSHKKICHIPSKPKYLRGLSKEKEIKLSKEASIFEMKLQKPHDPCESTKEKLKYGPSYQKPKQLKKLHSKDPTTDPKNLLEIQGKSFCKPDILENLYGTIAFKDFIIHKGYDMPGILEKFFLRKGWDYNSVNTPIPRILKNQEFIMQKQDDEDDEKERGKTFE